MVKKTETKTEALPKRVGFRGFARPVKIDAEAVETKIGAANIEGLYVYYTGNPYRARRASGRSASLRTITEVRKPVPVSELIRRAAKAGPNGTGYSPEFVRAGLFLHGGDKLAVYFPLEKRADGSFVAARDIPGADGYEKKGGLKKGDVVIEAPKGRGAKSIEGPKA